MSGSKKTLVMAGRLPARSARTATQAEAAGKPAATTLPGPPVTKRTEAKEKILRTLKRLHPME